MIGNCVGVFNATILTEAFTPHLTFVMILAGFRFSTQFSLLEDTAVYKHSTLYCGSLNCESTGISSLALSVQLHLIPNLGWQVCNYITLMFFFFFQI